MAVEEALQRIQNAALKQPALLLYKAAKVLERIDVCVEELHQKGVFSLLSISGDSIVSMKVSFSDDSAGSSDLKLEVKVHPIHTLQDFEIIFESPDPTKDLLNIGRVFKLHFENEQSYQITLLDNDPRTISLNEFIKALKLKISYPPN